MSGSSEVAKVKWTMAMVWIIWFGVFAAYSSLEVLQSSLNPTIGLISVSLLYTSTIITNLVGPVIILKLTPKWTVVISCMFRALLVAANFYPRWFTLIPAAVLTGVLAGPFSNCYNLYITVAAVRYAVLTGKSKTAMLSRFNGLVSTTIPLSVMFGSLVTSLILKYVKFDSVGGDTDNSLNMTIKSTISPLLLYRNNTYSYGNSSDSRTTKEHYNCGSQYCPTSLSSTSPEQSESSNHGNEPQTLTVLVLVTVLGSFNLCSVFVAIFGLANLSEEEIKDQLPLLKKEEHKCIKVKKYFTEYFDPRFFMLIPAAAYLHIMYSLFTGMFPKAYITCSVGIGMIGYIVMIQGFASLITSLVSGILGQYIHRNALFLFSFILVIIMVVMLLAWEHLPNQMVGFFTIAVINGVAGGNNNVHFHALIGDYFTEKKTEAFSFFLLIGGITIALGFLSVRYICVQVQLYLLLGLMAVSLVTYVLFIVYIKKPSLISTIKIRPITDQPYKELQTMVENTTDDESSDEECPLNSYK